MGSPPYLATLIYRNLLPYPLQAPESAGASTKPRHWPRTIDDLKGVAIFLGSYRYGRDTVID